MKINKIKINSFIIVFVFLIFIFIVLISDCSKQNENKQDYISATSEKLDNSLVTENNIVQIIENKTLSFGTNSNIRIMFKLNDNLVYSVPTQQNDGSYSMVVYKYNLKTDLVQYIGNIDYVGVYSNDYVAVDDSKVYTSIAYDKNFIESDDIFNSEQMRIIEIDLISNSISTIFTAPISTCITYVEYVTDNEFLIYDTFLKNSETDKFYSTVSMFNLKDNSMSTFITYENISGKQIVATQDNGLIYVLTCREKKYQIEVYDLQANLQYTIDLNDLNYFFYEPDGMMKTFQYMEVNNNMFVLTALGDSSIIFEYKEGKIIEKYVGDRLVSWDSTNSNFQSIKGYSTTSKSYIIDFKNRKVSLMNDIFKNQNSWVYTIYSNNVEDIFVVDTLTDRRKKYNLYKLKYTLEGDAYEIKD